jgi:hypothetical protein
MPPSLILFVFARPQQSTQKQHDDGGETPESKMAARVDSSSDIQQPT